MAASPAGTAPWNNGGEYVEIRPAQCRPTMRGRQAHPLKPKNSKFHICIQLITIGDRAHFFLKRYFVCRSPFP